MAVLSTISALILAAKEYFRWQAVKAEIESKRMIEDEMERIEDETKQLEKDIDDLRNSGDHDAADELLTRAARKARLFVGLDNLGKGGYFYSPSEDVSGGGLDNQTAAGSDSGSD